MSASERESGDRLAFLGHLRRRLAQPAPAPSAHPMGPARPGVPLVRSRLLDAGDLLGSFTRNAEAVHALVHRVTDPADVLLDVVARHGVRTAVVSREPAAAALAGPLTAEGVAVATLDEPGAAAAADLGVTGAVAAIATTGTVVLSTTAAGGRGASLLPRVHLCVVPAGAVVATSAEVLRRVGSLDPVPSNLVLVTGPSKSGDIEQIIVTGVHGPVALEIVLVDPPAPA